MSEVDDIVLGVFPLVPCHLVEDVSQRMHARSTERQEERLNINLNRVAISCGVCDWFLVS